MGNMRGLIEELQKNTQYVENYGISNNMIGGNAAGSGAAAQ
jgi:hypothetical protein